VTYDSDHSGLMNGLYIQDHTAAYKIKHLHLAGTLKE